MYYYTPGVVSTGQDFVLTHLLTFRLYNAAYFLCNIMLPGVFVLARILC